MKQIKEISLIIALLLTIMVKAQNFQGVATYETKRNFDMQLDSTQMGDEQQKAIRDMVRKQFEKSFTLTFSKTTSIYKEIKKLDTPQPQQGGIVFKMSGTDNTLYKNLKDQSYVEAQDMFGKKFLIKDKINPLEWKMEKETKMIGKYLCLKATYIQMINDFDLNGEKKEKQIEEHIIAWYTPEIPTANGPNNFGGLPGLILELHEGRMHYVCSKIVMNPKEKITIVAPTKGKVVTRKVYNEIMKKKQKEMMKNFDGGRKKGDQNRMTIRISG